MVALSGQEARDIAEHFSDFQTHSGFGAIKALNFDSNGRLRVSADATVVSGAVTVTGSATVSGSLTTLTNLTNLTNWGLFTAGVRTQVDATLDYNTGYRRNLVIS